MTNKIENKNHPFIKLFSGILCLFFALTISSVAAFFSVTGLATIFSAAFISVIVMGVVLESGKLVATGWLHSNWKNPRVGFLIKSYLSLAILALMVITGIGIYGYLSKAYLDQSAPAGVVDVQIQAYQQQIATDNSNISRLTAEQNQLDAQVNSLITQNKVYLSQTIRKQQASERANIQNEMNQSQQEIIELNKKIEPLQIQENGTNAKLGPVKYVAALIGWKDLDSAVRLVILIIMFAFDPLAVVLLLSGTISIGEWLDLKQSIKPSEKLNIDETIEPDAMLNTVHVNKNISDVKSLENNENQINSEMKSLSLPQSSEIDFNLIKSSILPDIEIKIPMPSKIEETVVATPIPEENKSFENIMNDFIETEHKNDKSKKTMKELVNLIEEQPEFLQELISIVTEYNQKNSK